MNRKHLTNLIKKIKNMDEGTKVNLCIIGFGIILLLLIKQIK